MSACAKPSMVDVGRARRLSKRIGTVVASAIEFEIKDPPLAFVTITDTKVTGDLHDATVFYTVRGETLQDEPDYAGAAAALERAKGTLRTKVGAAHRRAVHPDAGVRAGQGARYGRSTWRNCWLAPARPTPIWRGFVRVPRRRATRTRTVSSGAEESGGEPDDEDSRP